MINRGEIRNTGELPADGNGIHEFAGTTRVYWTDIKLDASADSPKGRAEIAEQLGVDLANIIGFDPKNHTNDVVIVDSPEGLEFAKDTSSTVGGILGWQTPLSPKAGNESLGAVPATYDGIILVNHGGELTEKLLLVTGADCTPVAIRGKLTSGEDFIAVAHGGRKGTLSGIIDSLVGGLQLQGVDPSSVEVFIGPAAQKIELPVALMDEQSGLDSNPRPDNSWRAESISEVYEKDGQLKTLYNNQYDTMRRVVELLGIDESQVVMVDADTVADEDNPVSKYHSFRTTATKARNSVIIGFKNPAEE